MKTDELKTVLDKHKKWLNDEDGGERANLSGANLSGANLYRADMSWANLSRADLSRAINVNDVNWNELTAFYSIVCPE